ncbi:MAG: hypothetical protein ABI218_16630 [Caldimonas sp.]
MAFGVLFVLLMGVSGWWLYSRWAEMRDSQDRRREAEMMLIFEAKGVRDSRERPTGGAGPMGDFHPTLPGDR